MNKREYKTLGDMIGMPDDVDKEHIKKMLNSYDKKHPGEIVFHRNTARDNQWNDFNVIDKQSNRRYLMELPPELFNSLEEYIPTLFREKKHFAWFCNNFPDLLIPRKY